MHFMTAGDSHGECLAGIISGFPAGHRIPLRDVEKELLRRRTVYGRSARQRVEKDEVRIVSGLWRGRSTGAPITILIENRSRTVAGRSGGALGTIPRPGHADFAGAAKYGFEEVPPISERASARSTAMRVAIGTLARSVLSLFLIDVLSHVISLGGVDANPGSRSFAALKRAAARSPLHCADRLSEKKMIEVIRQAKKDGDSLGGAVEVVVGGVIAGLGSHASWDRRLDGQLARAMMSIHSVKAVEIGDGLRTFRRKGYESHDAIHIEKGRVKRGTNFAGGIEGGMSNGEDIVLRLYAKPLPTSVKRLPSFDMKTSKPARAPFVRSDVCVVPVVGVIAEAVAAWEILSAMVDKFGGDSIDDMSAGYKAYESRLKKRGIR